MSGKRQHYIPRVLLKGFANEREQVYVFNKEKHFRTNVTNIGLVKNDFSRDVDDRITEIEYAQHQLLKNLDDERVLNNEENKLINEMVLFWRHRSSGLFKSISNFSMPIAKKMTPQEWPFGLEMDIVGMTERMLGNFREGSVDRFEAEKNKLALCWSYMKVDKPLILGDLIIVSKQGESYGVAIKSDLVMYLPIRTYGVLIGMPHLGEYSVNVDEINLASAANSCLFYICSDYKCGERYYRIFMDNLHARSSEVEGVLNDIGEIDYRNSTITGFQSILNENFSRMGLYFSLEQAEEFIEYAMILRDLGLHLYELNIDELNEGLKIEFESVNHSEEAKLLVQSLWVYCQMAMLLSRAAGHEFSNVLNGKCVYILDLKGEFWVCVYDVGESFFAIMQGSKPEVSVGDERKILVDSRYGYRVLEGDQ